MLIKQVIMTGVLFERELLSALQERDLSIQDLATALKMTFRETSRIAYGLDPVDKELAIQICTGLGMSLSELCGKAFDDPAYTM